MDGISFCSKIDDVYEKIVHWKHNLFEVPNGRAEEDFVNELSCLLEGYNDSTTLECIALKAAMVLSSLLLQRPDPKSKPKDHTRCLNKRLRKWLEGDVDSLMHECLSIQN